MPRIALPPAVVAPSPNTLDWTGIYVGGQAGFAGGRSSWSANATNRLEPSQAGALNFYQPFNPWTGTGSYFMGLQGGYNLMLPSRLVLGFEADVIAPSVIGGDERVKLRTLGPALYDEEMLIAGTVRGRIGYAWGNLLPYVTGGFAWTFDRVAFNDTESRDHRSRGAPANLRSPAALAIGLDNRRRRRISARAKLDATDRISLHRLCQQRARHCPRWRSASMPISPCPRCGLD